MITVNEELFVDFCEFSKLHIASQDIDPVYPVLKNHYDNLELDNDTRVWYTFLYQACYSLKSAEKLWKLLPHPARLNSYFTETYTTGTERRQFRGVSNKLVDHINSFMFEAGDHPYLWVSRCAKHGGTSGWDSVRRNVEMVRYNGPWAGYKWADLMLHVIGLDIEASDIGVGGMGEHAGPIPGMVKLTGLDWKVCAEDVGAQKELLELSRNNGVPFFGLDQLETSLCDFNSMLKGSYYVGHDIDMMMNQLHDNSELWYSRSDVIPEDYLGEKHDWFGVRTDMKKLYIDSGIIDWLNND